MLDAFKAVVLGSRVEPSTQPVHPDTSMGPMGMSGGYMGCLLHTSPHGPCGIMTTAGTAQSYLMLNGIQIGYGIEAQNEI